MRFLPVFRANWHPDGVRCPAGGGGRLHKEMAINTGVFWWAHTKTMSSLLKGGSRYTRSTDSSGKLSLFRRMGRLSPQYRTFVFMAHSPSPSLFRGGGPQGVRSTGTIYRAPTGVTRHKTDAFYHRPALRPVGASRYIGTARVSLRHPGLPRANT